MGVTHDIDIDITVNLEAAPLTAQGYNVLLLVDEALGNGLGGDRVKSFSTPAEAQTAQTAGEITTAVQTAINVALSQRPRPAAVLVGRVDTGAGTPETYPAALILCEAAAPGQFYAVCADTRTAAVQVALAAAVEADPENYMLFIQSSDADWLTASLPSAYSTLASLERTAVIFHDTDTQSHDLAWAVKYLQNDPEVEAATGTVPLRGVAALATGLTTTQRANLFTNNANVALQQGSQPYFVKPAKNCAGRPIHEILTSDWYVAAVKADIGQAAADFGDRGEKWTVTIRGAGTLRQILQGVGQRGINAGHFEPEQYTVSVPAPTTADANSGTLRGSTRAQIGNVAINYNVTSDMSRTPLANA